MRIGINLLPYREVAGIVIYIQNLLKNIGQIDKEDEFFIFIGRKTLPDLKFNYENFHYVETSIDSYRKIRRVLYEQLVLPFILKKYKIDVLFNPTVSGPVFWPGKKVTTIHDCAYDRFKEFDTFRTKAYFKLMFYGMTKLFPKIVTISNFSKKEIMNLYKVPSYKIKVIYEGPPEMEENLPSEIDTKKILEKFNIQNPYLFSIGLTRPRKNIPGLLRAFKIFSQKHQDVDLVLAGEGDLRFLNIKKIIKELNIEKKVIQTGFVKDKEKVILYKLCLALVFPSFYEGFGLPVLEAQSLGVPVLTSNTSSLLEVASDAVLYVDPYNVEEIAQGMEKIAFDEKLRQDLIRKGFENIKRFSWEKSAKRLLDLFHNL